LSVLKLLHEIGDLSLGTLSKEIGRTTLPMTGLWSMEAAGLVERARSEEDRRVWIIRDGEWEEGAARAKVSPWTCCAMVGGAVPSGSGEADCVDAQGCAHVQSAVQPRRAKENANGTRR